MLMEIPRTRQYPDELRRRWFTDEMMDLVVWFDEDDDIAAFQLCYDKLNTEKCITWKVEGGYLHTAVDDGEESGRYKRSPILISDGEMNAWSVCGEFRRRGDALEDSIRNLVSEKLINYSGNQNWSSS